MPGCRNGDIAEISALKTRVTGKFVTAMNHAVRQEEQLRHANIALISGA
jgi:hypothetical protein